MIDETDVVSYCSDNAPRADLTWLAQVVLSNGKFWGVYFTGVTEIEAVNKAVAFWNSEQERLGVKPKPVENNPWASVPSRLPDSPAPQNSRGIKPGAIWLIHKTTREKKVVNGQLAELLLASGEWEKGGPRSK